MKVIGGLLVILGAIATVVFGIQAIEDSESFTFLGMDIAVSTANWTPLIVSAIILITGLFIFRSGKK